MIVARPALPVGVAEVEIGVERFIGPGQESRIEAEINLESRPIRDAPAHVVINVAGDIDFMAANHQQH
jgi:hypothetical protein